MKKDRKEMIRQYKETPRPAGIYRVCHTPSGRTLLGTSPDAPAMLNRIRAQLRGGSHTNRRLQADWNADGPGAFELEVVDLLEPSDSPAYDPSEDLAALLALWVERLDVPEDLAY